jgi:hypothetical protein
MNWYYPDPVKTLNILDEISNENSKIIDSANIFYGI